MKACLLGLLGLLALGAGRAEEPWQVQARCVADVCVGDTVYTARKRLSAGMRLYETRQQAEWRDASGKLAVRFVLEDEPAPRPEARRIALIEVHRPGTDTGVNGLKLGDMATAQQLGGTGQWARAENALRWWVVQRPQAPGSDPYPLNLGVSEQQRLVQVVLNGNRLRETSYRRLGDALAADHQRVAALDLSRAAVPEVPAAAQPPGVVHADLEWLPELLTLRYTSRPDCSVAACEILRVEVGGRAPGPDDGPRIKLLGADAGAARFRPTRCAGSCTPASIAFMRQGRPVRMQFDTRFGRPGANPSTSDQQSLLSAMATSTLR